MTLIHYLIVSGFVFALGMAGIVLHRQNIIILLMCVELMLLAVNTNFIAFSHYLNNAAGQVFVFFVLTVAAAEAAIGLAIVMVVFRKRGTLEVDKLTSLRG